MKRLLIAACAAAVSVIAFTSQAAGAVAVNQWFSFSTQMFSCSGERIDGQVNGHLLTRDMPDAQGDGGSTLTLMFHGISTSGASYAAQSHVTVQNGEAAGTFTANQNLILRGEGTHEDFRSHALVHLTVNANGELVVDNHDFRFVCDVG